MAANNHLYVKSPIKFGRNILTKGRVIHTSDPTYYIEKYGDKVALWNNWPKPFEEATIEKKGKKDDTKTKSA